MTRAQLAAAYRATEYQILMGAAALALVPGQPAPAQLFRRLGSRQGAFITADNPRSRTLTRRQNRWRRARLARRVRGATVLPGVGRDSLGAWPEEWTLLVAGLGRRRARALARRFGQHAWLHLQRGRPVCLAWT